MGGADFLAQFILFYIKRTKISFQNFDDGLGLQHHYFSHIYASNYGGLVSRS